MNTLENSIVGLVYSKKKPPLTSEATRKIFVLTLLCLLAVLTLSLFFIEAMILGNTVHGYVLLANIVLIMAIIVYIRISGSHQVFSIAVVFQIGAFCVYLALSQGMERNGTVWCLIFPIFSFYVLGYRAGFICNSFMAFVFGVLLFIPSTPFFHAVYSIQFAMRFLFSYFFISIMSMTLEYSRQMAQDERDRVIGELREALANVKTLSGLLPICARCKKIRNDKGYWEDVEKFIEEKSGAIFTHGLCASCGEKLYGDQEWYRKSKL